jgi:hypothetical protein
VLTTGMLLAMLAVVRAPDVPAEGALLALAITVPDCAHGSSRPDRTIACNRPIRPL